MRDWGSLIEGFSREFTAIGHTDDKPRFFRSEGEMNSAKLEYPIVLFVPGESYYLDGLSDNIFRVNPFEVYILKGVEKQKFAQETAAYNDCFAIAEQFIAKMNYLRGLMIDDENYADRIPYFHPKDCRISKDGPIGKDNCYGVCLSVKTGEPAGLVINEELWSEV